MKKLFLFLGFGIYFGFWILNFGFSPSLAQSPKVDSLLQVLNTTTEDTTRISALNALGWELMYTNPDTAILLSTQALALAQGLPLLIQGGGRGEVFLANSLGNPGVYIENPLTILIYQWLQKVV